MWECSPGQASPEDQEVGVGAKRTWNSRGIQTSPSTKEKHERGINCPRQILGKRERKSQDPEKIFKRGRLKKLSNGEKNKWGNQGTQACRPKDKWALKNHSMGRGGNKTPPTSVIIPL